MEKELPKPMTLTPDQAQVVNTKMIVGLMKKKRIKGNFKDYVIISGMRLLDYNGSYTLNTPEGKQIIVATVALVHKRELHKILGEGEAEAFWHRKLGQRTVRKER